MIQHREKTTKTAKRSEFQEWANLFSERLFVMIQVFMDESGTNDPHGKAHGSSTPTVSGWVAFSKILGWFWPQMEKSLDNYRISHFHFREYVDRTNKNHTKGNPFIGLSDEDHAGILYDLAFVTSRSTADAIPVGGSFSAKLHHESGMNGNPFEGALRTFFEDLKSVLKRHWLDYPGKILFVYDLTTDPGMVATIHTVYNEYRAKDSRFGGITFQDDKDPMHLPLQAADLLSFASRQQAERVFKDGKREIPQQRTLDFILNRNLFERGGNLSNKRWQELVGLIRSDHKMQKTAWSKLGIKREYYPATDFPFEKYGFKATKRNAI